MRGCGGGGGGGGRGDRGENRKGGDSQRESAVELAVGKRKEIDKEEE